MACCEEKQTECLRVVNIAYLKTFVGNDVHSSIDNSVISIDESKGSGYCPTYGELTRGLIIQTGSTDTSNPFNNVDGIVVNPIFSGGSAPVPYNDDQVVDKQDLSLIYTRFRTLSISLAKTSGLNACSGESTTVTTTHNYTRYTKTMTDCTGGNPTTTSTTVNGLCTNVEWSTKYGNVTNCNTYTIDKNSTDSARTDVVQASVKWRGTKNSSNEVNVTQLAPTGGEWIEIDKVITRTLTNCQASPSTLTLTGFTSGNTYIIPEQTVIVAAISSETTVTKEKWVDGCGIDGEERETSSATSGNVSSSYTFSRMETPCCELPASGLLNDVRAVMISFGEASCSKTFSAISQSCSGTSACSEPVPEECNKILGTDKVYCEGPYQYTIGSCSDPDPVIGVRTMDNMGQVCKTGRPTCDNLKQFANPDCGWYDEANHILNWWSGPHAGEDDPVWRCGVPASGQNEYECNDSYRYDFNDNNYWPRCTYGSSNCFDHSKATSAYTSPDGKFSVVSNNPDWIQFNIYIAPHQDIQTGCDSNCIFPGVIGYIVAPNTSNVSRVGTLTVTTAGGECPCECWRQRELSYQTDWITKGTVYIYQKGQGQ